MVKKWDNGAAVRIIPAAVPEAAQVRLDHPVDMREQVEPLRPTRRDTDALIAGITDENLHDPIDMGQPVGQEVW